MKSYMLCGVDQVIFHSGLPHFRGLWREYGVSGSGKYKLTPGMFSPPSSE